MARISVVIITCNRREQLRETLAHMTSLPDEAPIFVADNGSGDGTAGMVAREFPGVRLFRQSAAGDWGSVIAEIRPALSERSAAASVPA